jgi:molybdopterin-guanine dinucleotide biosynthesis protein B
MIQTRAISVVGYKNSGKTRVVEALVSELTGRGYKVGTLKHTAESVLLDTPGKDTWRHREAGSVATAILHGNGSALFIDRYMTIQEAISKMGQFDYVVTEGFKSLDIMAKIIVPRKTSEIEELTNGLEIAIIELDERKIQQVTSYVIPITRIEEIADLVEKRAFPMLAGLNCNGCGYNTCLELGRAILAGHANFNDCVRYSPDFMIKVNDASIDLGPFVQNVTKNVILGLVRSFKGVKEPTNVELKFKVSSDD